jgi:hypothetical protein
VFPVAVKTWLILVPDPFEAPLTPDCETVQKKEVDATLLLSAIEVALPEHKVCDEGVAVADGTGLTVMVEVSDVPVQDPIVGVIVYTAVPAIDPVVLRVCAITLPDPAEAPLRPVCVTVQL